MVLVVDLTKYVFIFFYFYFQNKIDYKLKTYKNNTI
jgi:hypothetical protein